MTNYREILRLSSLGTNNSQITESMGTARQTVITTLQRAGGPRTGLANGGAAVRQGTGSAVIPAG